MKYLFLLLGLATFVFAEGPIERFYKEKFQGLEDNKALAIAIDSENGKWTIGWSYNAASKASAKKTALKHCEKSAKKNKIFKQCTIYAVNNRKYNQ